MAEQFRIDSADVSAVADELADLSDRMTGHVSGLGVHVAGAGTPWGSDATGVKFAGVAQGFVAHMQASLQTMATHAEKLQRRADDLAAAADAFHRADQA